MRAEAPFILVDGRVPAASDLFPFALANDGHFTAMQVRDRAVRGIGLHLRRLVESHKRLYGTLVDAGSLRSLMQIAVANHPDAYLRVTVAEPDPGMPSVLTVVRPPVDPEPQPVALLPTVWTRALPEVKHVGTFPQIQFAREAERAGFDDALLVDEDGRLSETTIANIAFASSDEVVWPDGPALEGITWQLLERALAEHGIFSRRASLALDDLDRFSGAVLVNSVGVTPVGRIGARAFMESADAAARLERIYRSVPEERI